ncbi:hypothetical protein [Pseudooceanicola batsensis]|uniref:hypothetical protein n=1 Tax=Pseudooceanicola batsensis TaxID=314255 RepID=UPI0011D19061|nr:hypothetical protein [Pseudooceanicola batsensis]
MRIELVADPAARAELERGYQRCERRDQLLGAVLQRAEARYIAEHLKPDARLNFTPVEFERSYADELRRVKTAYHARPEIDALKERATARSRNGWRTLSHAAREIARHQQDTHLSKEAFSQMRSNRAEVSRSFQRAVGR